MITDKQRKNQILRRLQKLPPDKIKELHEFIQMFGLLSAWLVI